jgi:predicted TPR repeat methyltransferase
VTDWARFYDDLAANYDEVTSGADWSVNDRAADLLGPLALSPDRVLDLGAGTGQTATMLRGLYGDVVLTLVEPSEAMVAVARDKVDGARFVVDDAIGFLAGTTEQWHLVAALGFLELVPDISAVLRLAAARLVPGGHLVVSHEPLLEDASVQSRPTSRVQGGLEVHRRTSADVEGHAASYGLTRVASEQSVAFDRTDGGGPAVYEIVVWTSPTC